jgi:hypothetical protein
VGERGWNDEGFNVVDLRNDDDEPDPDVLAAFTSPHVTHAPNTITYSEHHV